MAYAMTKAAVIITASVNINPKRDNVRKRLFFIRLLAAFVPAHFGPQPRPALKTDTETHECIQPAGRASLVMLAIEQPHGPIKFVFRAGGGILLSARGAFDVLHDDPGVIVHAPTGLLKAIGPIEGFTVHPESFVQQAHLFDRRAPDQHKRAA